MGEVVRHIIGKVVLHVVGHDIVEVVGCELLCAGQPGGCEAAVHAIRHLFESADCEAVLLANARNAFNSLDLHSTKSGMQMILQHWESCPQYNPGGRSFSVMVLYLDIMQIPLSLGS